MTRPLVNVSPDLLNSVYVCHFHSLFSFVITAIHTILAGGTTHIAVFFSIAIAWIDLTKTFRSQKLIGIVPPDKLFE